MVISIVLCPSSVQSRPLRGPLTPGRDFLKCATCLDEIASCKAFGEGRVQRAQLLECLSLRRAEGEPLKTHDGAKLEAPRRLRPRDLDGGGERALRRLLVGRRQEFAAKPMELRLPSSLVVLVREVEGVGDLGERALRLASASGDLDHDEREVGSPDTAWRRLQRESLVDRPKRGRRGRSLEAHARKLEESRGAHHPEARSSVRGSLHPPSCELECRLI